LLAVAGFSRMPRPPARGRARSRGGACRWSGASGGASCAREPGAATEGARLPLRHARPGRLPFGQSQRAGLARHQASLQIGRTMNSLTPLPAPDALDAYFLEARSKLLDVAAILDRIGRGTASNWSEDPRLAKVRQALEVLSDRSGGRAERVQRIF